MVPRFKQSIHVRFPLGLLNLIKDRAKLENRSMSGMVRQIVQKHFDREPYPDPKMEADFQKWLKERYGEEDTQT